MRRILTYLLTCLLVVCSCIREPEEQRDVFSSYPEGAKVTVRFTVAAEGLVPTKAQSLGEDKPLESLHLAVFGSSGYLKEYVEATIDDTPCGSIAFEDPNDPEKITNVPLYGFTAKLTLTDSKRIIHFIGNGPSTLSFGYADAVLSSLLSTSGERAYWQMMEIDGIKAKTSTTSYTDHHGNSVEIGDYIDANGDKITNGEGYVVSTDTQDQFKEIPLVRNWAKIVVEADRNNDNDPYFTPISYAVVHVPDRGTLAPHSAATNGFIKDYQKKTYFDIVNLGYPANLPPNASMDETIPDITDFTRWDPEADNYEDPSTVEGIGWKNGVAPAGQYGAVYLYERPVPSDQLPPTFVIIYGMYDNPDDQAHKGKCFYKVDLMTDHKYYPVYRNFQYRILIHSILSQGHSTPQAAAAAAGSADVSADINARHLPDISDGIRRLAIQNWMAQTFTDAQHNNTELSAYFMSDVTLNQPNMDAEAVTLEVLPMKRGIDPVITSCSIDPPESADPNDEAYGWRTIHFSTSGPSNTIRSQTLRVIGTSGGDFLYRDIVITIQEIQDMLVRCSDRRIKAEKGTPVDVYISIPDGLAESMFPLQFQIEPVAMTLSPNNDNLPVQYGPSISDSGKSSFHFIRTLDWDEYRSLPTELDASDKLWRRITCHFVSNRDISSTAIWVRNDEYFTPATTDLSNFSDKSFHHLQFLEPIKQESGLSLTLSFEVDRDPDFPEITLMLDGMIPQARENLPLPDGFTAVSDVSFRFTPTESPVMIPFVTADNTGEVYVKLSAEDYESQSVKTHYFTLFHDIGFIDGHKLFSANKWSNVANGLVNTAENKTVLFGYFDDPAALNPTINLRNLDGLNKMTPTGYPWTPDGPRSPDGERTYHELEFQTANNDLQRPVSFILSSPGYLEVPVSAGRFRGNIYTNNDGNSTVNLTSSLTVSGINMGNNSNHTCTVELSGDFTVNNNGAWLEAGQSGTITISNTNMTKYKLFYVQFNIGKSNNKMLFPRMDATVTAGTFEKYPGGNDHCLWILPKKEKTDVAPDSITITAPNDSRVNIKSLYIKNIYYN